MCVCVCIYIYIYIYIYEYIHIYIFYKNIFHNNTRFFNFTIVNCENIYRQTDRWIIISINKLEYSNKKIIVKLYKWMIEWHCTSSIFGLLQVFRCGWWSSGGVSRMTDPQPTDDRVTLGYEDESVPPVPQWGQRSTGQRTLRNKNTSSQKS